MGPSVFHCAPVSCHSWKGAIAELLGSPVDICLWEGQTELGGVTPCMGGRTYKPQEQDEGED